ncbi:hypothetical protein NAU58_14965 [Pseudomonas stutzeri]|uniref:Uncharacterized protein n=1 Tax=Stutzerimonas stutzeri TaxID=316 RepID=A0A2N8S4V4_STUST|nr:hypothetical protein [Stutzerimonas stutzeri]MCQ4296880.1 hypothetical protein [Stutzerimonas stutzeri]PNF81655.1 hypothetical protein CXK92_07445 [Stutzerimonas stutzeri]
MDVNPIRAAIALWYAQMAWAKELISRSFGLEKAENILRSEYRGHRIIPGTSWYIRTHSIGVDVYKTLDTGGIDFDFNKPHPDDWRMRIFVQRQVNDGNLPFEPYRELLDNEELMSKAVTEALSTNA